MDRPHISLARSGILCPELQAIGKWEIEPGNRISSFHPIYSPTAKLCYGVFSPDQLRCDPVQLQHQVPDKVPEGSGADTL